MGLEAGKSVRRVDEGGVVVVVDDDDDVFKSSGVVTDSGLEGVEIETSG